MLNILTDLKVLIFSFIVMLHITPFLNTEAQKKLPVENNHPVSWRVANVQYLDFIKAFNTF